jgi:hypothetical protein
MMVANKDPTICEIRDVDASEYKALTLVMVENGGVYMLLPY